MALNNPRSSKRFSLSTQKQGFSHSLANEIEEESDKDSIIEAFNLKNGPNDNENEESLSDLKTFVKSMDDDELQTELPRRIFNSIRGLAQNIATLEKDEYGDYIYREKDLSDNASQNLKKASNILKFWLNLLKSANKHTITSQEELKEIKPETANKEIQVGLSKLLTIKTSTIAKRNFKLKNTIKSPDIQFKKYENSKGKSPSHHISSTQSHNKSKF